MRSAWAALRRRYEAYELLLPGDPSFICQPQVCDAHCCRKFSVSAGEADVARMQRETGWTPVQFLECESGEPIGLPLVKPYLLRRAAAGCAMLGDDLSCGVYSGRPDACRQYPYQVLFADPAGALVRPKGAEALRALRTVDVTRLLALLVRHVECPGFTGPALAPDDWDALRRRTYELQGGPAW